MGADMSQSLLRGRRNCHGCLPQLPHVAVCVYLPWDDLQWDDLFFRQEMKAWLHALSDVRRPGMLPS